MPPVSVSQKDADRMVAYEADVRDIFINGTAGGTPLLPVQFSAADYDGPPVAGGFANFMKATFIAMSRMMMATQALNNSFGPLPKTSASFTTRGQTLLVIASGSGFHASAGQLIGMNIQIDAVNKGVSLVYTNEAASHKAFITNPLIITGIAAGAHTVSLTATAGTLSDGNDFYNATVIELPF